MILASLFVLFLTQSLANPVPVSDNPIPPTSSTLNTIVRAVECTFQCDPRRVRTLWEIVYNCMSTITLCTFFAIHHNIPDPSASTMGKIWQKIRTTLYALLAPEAVIALAMRQRFVASRIARQYRAHGWTKAHGFFVQMGGLIHDDGERYRVITIGPMGDVRLEDQYNEEPERAVDLPDITEEEIQDKGKGNFISKAVVVTQTTWFVCNCIARHSQSLAITKLELVTLAFAALNIITYLLWWDKPLDAQHPIYFKSREVRSRGPPKKVYPSAWTMEGSWALWSSRKGKESSSPPTGNDTKERRRITQLLWRFVKLLFLSVFLPLRDMMGKDNIQSSMCVGPYYAGRLNTRDKDKLIILSTLIGIGFGGIHLIGWNFEYPTRAEQVLWRTTSTIITVEPAFLGLHFSLHYLSLTIPRDTAAGRILGGVTSWTFLFFGYIGPIVYTIARITLLVQSLVSLRDNSPSIYANVFWSAYLPHV